MGNVTSKLIEAYAEVNEKKKMDPVGQADADIDNDGDVDKSDKYLHNRRKAVKKAMKDDEMNEAYESVCKEMKKMHDEGYGKKAIMAKYKHMEMATVEKLYAQTCSTKEEVEENSKASLAKKLAKASAPSEKGKKAVTLKKAPWDKNEANNDEEIVMNPKKDKDKKAEADTMANESVLPSVYARIMENRAKQTKGATAPEGMMDNSKSSKGAMDMVNQPKEINDDDEKGHEDASKAGRVGPSAKARPADNMKGDKKVIPSATPMKGK